MSGPEPDWAVVVVRKILKGMDLKDILLYGDKREAKKALKYWLVLNAIQQDSRSLKQEAQQLPQMQLQRPEVSKVLAIDRQSWP